MGIKIKSNINTNKIMSEINNQVKESLQSEQYDIECPHCNNTFNAHAGHNVCPHCNNEVTLNLDFNF